MQSVSVVSLNYGIFKVIFNTETRWLKYQARLVDGIVYVEVLDSEGDHIESFNIEVLSSSAKYSLYHNQEKDQIYVLLVPNRMLI